MAKKRDPLERGRAKLQPKLQMIANGASDVNAVRAGQCAGLRVTQKLADQTARRREAKAPSPKHRKKQKLPPRGSITRLSTDVEADVFIQLNDGSPNRPRFRGEIAQQGNVVSARVRLSELPSIAANPRVAFVEIGEAVKPPRPQRIPGQASAPLKGERALPDAARHKYGEGVRHGEGVLIGIIDVEGFDFSHPDFLDASGRRTRWVAIWDQAGTRGNRPAEPRFGYGTELLQADLNAALSASRKLGVPPYELEPQSQMVEGSHGTHVASTAAGNRGICRKASIAGVLISLPEGDQDRSKSFYDSTRIADAVDYLVSLADGMGKRVAINISLGTNGHAHDGAGAIGRWIDSVLAIPGRAVTVAAGNAGQEKGETPDDLGWLMGRIHTAGQIPAAGLTADIEWIVVGDGLVDVSENELELWLNPQDRFEVSLLTPAGEWIGPLSPREFIENRRLSDGSFISIYNAVYHPSNGANYISVYLSPNLRAVPVIGVPSGKWVVRLRGQDIRDGRYDGWIERDDPRPRGAGLWSFPSFFSERSLVDNTTVSSLGCGNRTITVANYDGKNNRINISSSQGPTRDGRFKPDVAAPGTAIVAAKGFSRDEEQWIAMTGTSMASPYVCGVAGLMLATEPRLSAAQIEGIMRSTARPLPGASFRWMNDAGFGVLVPEACLEEAAMVNKRKDRTGQ